MALDVKIIINTVKPVGSVGFGCPLILEENATKAIEYTEVNSLEKLVATGYVATTNVYKVAQLMFMQEHAPQKIAVCSITTGAEDWVAVEDNVRKDWRQLVVVNAGETATNVAGIMTAIEAQKTYPKMYYANLDYEDSTISASSVKGVERTVLCYYDATADIPCPVAALVGEVGGLEVGSYTLNNMTVKGIEGLEISEAEIETLHEKGGITFVVSAGDVVTSEGITAGGLFVDNIDGDDYIKQQLEYKTQKVFNNNLKVPYTNVGIALLESAATSVMKDAFNKGIVESYEIRYDLRENVDKADIDARRYIGGNISYVRAGAIHKIEINCAVSN